MEYVYYADGKIPSVKLLNLVVNYLSFQTKGKEYLALEIHRTLMELKILLVIQLIFFFQITNFTK
jgi:hypothetical protein